MKTQKLKIEGVFLPFGGVKGGKGVENYAPKMIYYFESQRIDSCRKINFHKQITRIYTRVPTKTIKCVKFVCALSRKLVFLRISS